LARSNILYIAISIHIFINEMIINKLTFIN